MVDKLKALDILNNERDYEEKLASDLESYFIICLDYIEELTKEQKETIRKSLTIIIRDSNKHSYLFNQLIQMVTYDGEDNF